MRESADKYPCNPQQLKDFTGAHEHRDWILVTTNELLSSTVTAINQCRPTGLPHLRTFLLAGPINGLCCLSHILRPAIDPSRSVQSISACRLHKKQTSTKERNMVQWEESLSYVFWFITSVIYLVCYIVSFFFFFFLYFM